MPDQQASKLDLHAPESRSRLAAICRKHGILRLCLIGSQARGDHTADSDVDFLVRFTPSDQPLRQYFDARDELAELCRRPVDLIEEDAVHHSRFRASVEADQQVLHEA